MSDWGCDYDSAAGDRLQREVLDLQDALKKVSLAAIDNVTAKDSEIVSLRAKIEKLERVAKEANSLLLNLGLPSAYRVRDALEQALRDLQEKKA